MLRKKPPGEVLASAHAVEREYQVLAALQRTRVPVPPALCLCTDAAVLGTPFYVMGHVQVLDRGPAHAGLSGTAVNVLACCRMLFRNIAGDAPHERGLGCALQSVLC